MSFMSKLTPETRAIGVSTRSLQKRELYVVYFFFLNENTKNGWSLVTAPNIVPKPTIACYNLLYSRVTNSSLLSYLNAVWCELRGVGCLEEKSLQLHNDGSLLHGRASGGQPMKFRRISWPQRGGRQVFGAPLCDGGA